MELDRPVRARGREYLVKTRGGGWATRNCDDNWQQWLVFHYCYFTSIVSRGHGSIPDS